MRLKKMASNKKMFLGGTCADSNWRDILIPLLTINFFDPRVDDWNEEAQKNEIFEREHDDFVLYTITPRMEGVYSIAEVVDDSNKRPEKTLFCFLEKDDEKEFTEGQIKSLKQVAEMVKHNGGHVFFDLKDIANFVNSEANINE